MTDVNEISKKIGTKLDELRREANRVRREAKDETDETKKAGAFGGASGTLKTVEAITEVCISCGLLVDSVENNNKEEAA